MRYRIIMLDLDGTLMDSGEGIMKCAAHALGKKRIAVEDWHSLRCFVGPPLEDSFKEFYGFSDEEAHMAVMAYRERYLSVGRLEQRPYDGVMEFLAELRGMGMTLCLATSKMVSQSIFVTEHFGLSPYIDHIFARDDEGRLHTKSDVINNGLETLHVEDRSEVLMIGDRKFDIIGAKKCGLDSVGVLYGYGDRDELEKAGATYICKDFNEILDVIKRK